MFCGGFRVFCSGFCVFYSGLERVLCWLEGFMLGSKTFLHVFGLMFVSFFWFNGHGSGHCFTKLISLVLGPGFGKLLDAFAVL